MTTRLVVVSRPDGNEIRSLRHADVCSTAAATQAGPTASTSAAGTAGSGPKASTSEKGTNSGSRSEGVLGTRFTRRALETVSRVPPWLYGLLLVAIGLLAVGALPIRAAPSNRATAILARRRGTIALAGAAVLVGTMVAYVLL